MKIAVLGGSGLMGSGVVTDLHLEGSEDIEKVYVADFNYEKAKKDVAALKDDRFKAVKIDVKDKNQLLSLFGKVDVCSCIIAAPMAPLTPILDAAIEAGIPYVDIAGGHVRTMEEQKRLHDKALAAGVPAVIGCGSAPGTTNMVAKNCIENLDTVEKVEVFWGGYFEGPDSPVFVPPYSLLTVIEEFVSPSFQYIDGKLVERPALEGRKYVDLPSPFGKTCFYHSAVHEEPYMLSNSYKDKNIKEIRWRLHIPEQIVNTIRELIKCGFGDFTPITYDGKEIVPAQFLNDLVVKNIAKNEKRIPDAGYEEVNEHEIYFTVAEGTKNGRKEIMTTTVLQEPDKCFEPYIDALTSQSASICTRMLGKGMIQPGVWFPEEALDTKAYFEEVRKRGYSVSVKEEYSF